MSKRRMRLIAFVTLMCASGLATLVTTVLTIAPQEDLFKGFDFDKFLEELEDALSQIEEEEKTKAPAGATPAPTGAPTEAGKTIAADGTTTIERKESTKKDPASLFLDPSTQTTTKGKQKTVEPMPESINAYRIIMNEFVDALRSIEKKVISAGHFSPTFKEEFLTYASSIIDHIAVAHDQIESKKFYMRLFLSPPESNKTLAADMKKLRQMILDASAKIKNLDKKLVISAAQEEEESSEDVLRKLAAESDGQQPKPPAPVTKKSKPTKPAKSTVKKAPTKPFNISDLFNQEPFNVAP